ncbi:SidA/IucD/PvdA family monooxygenase [Pontibacillus yanchengensis]|uniref:SidA/IucD/PvdA family monooxygenase n=1 Tax=Pontibacillus yanchengensis TaxID=462910 RepID=A0ACC7VJ81_9BACI|nr:NAD(P)-binding domain-containing protein [Pontibacillus yanchengensis]MYL54827.1 SidA/IucD/PvdA family monooxygenase [Pontibacillus yanchengensis]
MNTNLPVAIIGGGPIGLAAAAQLSQQNQPFILFESGNQIGTNFLDYGHVRLFSPWKYNMDSAAKELLKMHAISLPDEERLPYGKEIVDDYLIPLASLPEMKPYIHVNSKVHAITRKGFDKVKTANREQAPFVIQVQKEHSNETYEARAVIDATGTWQNPNPVGAGGIRAEGEEETSNSIRYGIPDVLNTERKRYEGKKVVIVGSGHSAINTLLDLAELPDTELHWLLRKKDVRETYGGMEDDALPGRGALGTKIQELIDSGQVNVHTPMIVRSITQEDQTLTIHGEVNGDETTIEEVDEIVSTTGARPTFDFVRELRYTFDPTLESVPELAELIDPNIHSCGTVRAHGEKELRQPEPNFYIIGAKSYGRAPTFLLATGYEQARSVVAYLSGDFDRAKEVHLNLPETGVCNSGNLFNTKSSQGSCC